MFLFISIYLYKVYLYSLIKTIISNWANAYNYNISLSLLTETFVLNAKHIELKLPNHDYKL